jgi:RNA polymerase sigma-70 factor (ECF subfamily)
MSDDAQLLEQIRRGDTAAFDVFYLDNAPRLETFLRHLLGSPQAAEDVANETFLQLWRQSNGFNPESGSLRAYLFGIARKRAAE